ncbi:hypothetical protein BOFE_09180 (plasmid) [Candidatus Borrelia fainii]|uniref:Uncharacterized protein n=1 Tax=Candidatus Borrelia fainii TaxID=2518322 RepID=A0ABM8DLA3_9SPIR|nr:hypothetical protein BOFE_09180 [Candidatus Borrelia fainii]
MKNTYYWDTKNKRFIRNSDLKVPNKPFKVTGPYIKSDTLHVNLY